MTGGCSNMASDTINKFYMNFFEFDMAGLRLHKTMQFLKRYSLDYTWVANLQYAGSSNGFNRVQTVRLHRAPLKYIKK